MGRHYPVKCYGLTCIFLPHSYVEALIVPCDSSKKKKKLNAVLSVGPS